jgi:hypothetical protein
LRPVTQELAQKQAQRRRSGSLILRTSFDVKITNGIVLWGTVPSLGIEICHSESTSSSMVALEAFDVAVKCKCNGFRQFCFPASWRTLNQNWLLPHASNMNLSDRDFVNDVFRFPEFLPQFVGGRKHLSPPPLS